MSRVRASKQSEGSDAGQDVRAQVEWGGSGGLPPSSGPDPEGNRMGGGAHLSGGGWPQQYGPDYKEGFDSINKHIKNDGCQVSHQQEKLLEWKGGKQEEPCGVWLELA